MYKRQISGLRGYIKLQRQLSGILDGVRKELREKIKAAYNDIDVYKRQALNSIKISDSVTSIGDYAFGECDSLSPQVKSDIIQPILFAWSSWSIVNT